MYIKYSRNTYATLTLILVLSSCDTKRGNQVLTLRQYKMYGVIKRQTRPSCFLCNLINVYLKCQLCTLSSLMHNVQTGEEMPGMDFSVHLVLDLFKIMFYLKLTYYDPTGRALVILTNSMLL